MEFSDKKQAERFRTGFGFSRLLAEGETITQGEVTVSVLRGVDATPNALLNGSCTIDGASLWQEVIGGIPDTYYVLEFKATTSNNHVFIERGTLRVVK